MSNMRVISFGDRSKKEVALTFDDGPNPFATFKILDILGFYNVKATFFVIGKRCLEYPDVLKAIYQQGHLIGNHTFSHNRGDFRACDQEIIRILGKETTYVRPPFYDLTFCSAESKYLESKLIVTGDVDSKDYLSISPIEITENVVANAKNGSIIDLHDGSEIDKDLPTRAQKTIIALPEIITRLHTNRFNFKKINEIKL